MTSVNTGYEARLRDILKQAVPKASSFSGLPTVGFASSSSSDATGFVGRIAPYLIYALLVTFVILLILIIVHYTLTPIFNFGDNPTALINLTVPDWTKSWDKADSQNVDTPASLILAKSNYSLLLDVHLKQIAPSAQMGNMYVIAYKTAGLIPTSWAGVSGVTTAIKNGNGEDIKAKLLTNFSFLDTPRAPSPITEPSLLVVYDALKGLLTVFYSVSTGTTNFFQSVYTPIRPNTSYRVGIVVSSTQVELYINGQYASSKIYPGKTIAGTDNDVLISTPSVFSGNVRVANSFSVNRVVSSGEIRGMGGPATMKLD